MIEWLDTVVFNFCQSIQNDTMTVILKWATNLCGNGGWIWIALGVSLLLFKKTRMLGVMVFGALLLGVIFGNGILKNVFARPRPCWRHPEIVTLVTVPTDYSFPSGHTLASFGAAVSVFLENKKWGSLAVIFACMVAFSRVYFSVHYATDVLGAIILGIGMAILSRKLIQFFIRKRSEA